MESSTKRKDGDMLKTYAVRFTYPNTVDLLAYESKAVDSGLITLPMIAGNHSIIMMVSTQKKRIALILSKEIMDQQLDGQSGI